MDVFIAEKKISQDVLLYPMQGFYLLSVPLEDQITGFAGAYLGSHCVVLCNQHVALQVAMNHKVCELLKTQSQRASSNPNVLGVITQPLDKSASLSSVDFPEYHPFDHLYACVSEEQMVAITRYNQEQANETS